MADARKKYLAFGAPHGDIVAVRHDLPHMPSLGVSSLDLGRLWRHRRPPFFRTRSFVQPEKILPPRNKPAALSLRRHLRAPDFIADAARQQPGHSEQAGAQF